MVKELYVARLINFLLFLFFLSLVFSEPGFSQDFLSGQILEVNNEKMELMIGVNEIKEAKGEYQKIILIRPAKENILPKDGDKSVFPGCVVTGDKIRIWGDWKNNKQKVFFAHDIRGCRGGGCSDPTGIISRLKKFSDTRGDNRKHTGSGRRGGQRGARHHGGHE